MLDELLEDEPIADELDELLPPEELLEWFADELLLPCEELLLGSGLLDELLLPELFDEELLELLDELLLDTELDDELLLTVLELLGVGCCELLLLS